jgi:lipid-binding SYLF domain-containing protein
MLSGFWSEDTREEKREKYRAQKRELKIQKRARRDENKKILRELYSYNHEARYIIKQAYGYATFSSTGVTLLFISGESGKGMAHNNTTGQNTFMNMTSGGVGIGLGVKDFRAIFVFENKKAFNDFVNNGWLSDAGADAALKVGKDGGATTTAISIASGVKLYKLTKNGLILGATMQGTKYSKDEDLN